MERWEDKADTQQVRERAVRMVFEHQAEYQSQWEAITSIASKFGMELDPAVSSDRRIIIRGEQPMGS